MRMYVVGIGLSMVPRERSRSGRLARSDNLPVGTRGDLVNGDGLVYRQFHGEFNQYDANSKVSFS